MTHPTTPAASTTSSRPAGTGPLSGKVITIDPGHDGANWAHPAQINQPVPAGGFTKACDTTGTTNTNGYTESAFNLDVALRLGQDLQRLGATVVFTRTTDTGWGPCVNERAAVGNRAHADAAISIHADGGPPGGRGFEVIQPALVPGYTNGIVEPSHRLALAVRNNFARATGMPVADYIGSNGIDTRSDLGGLNLSTVPKVFVECGNMRNGTDSGLQSDAGWRQRVADGLALGIGGYLHGVTG
jgi:N-acetylmuramoyl-L-alanine amidase